MQKVYIVIGTSWGTTGPVGVCATQELADKLAKEQSYHLDAVLITEHEIRND